MFDRILEIGTTFDWISPILAMAESLLNGPSHTFIVPGNCGRSGRDIEKLLADHGVRIWGKMMVNRTIMFTVRLKQASWADYVLRQAGIPTLSKPVPALSTQSSRRRSARHAPSLLRTLNSWLDKLA